MPGFFDFTDPGANSPMDNGEQSWGGDMIYGGNQPIAPPANPFDSFMPQMPQGGMNTQVPFDALSAMNGIQMPQIPQQDSMGRYGINDTQRADAGRQSLASILMGAGRTMFDDNPNAVLQAAAGSGDIRRGALDKASQENVNAFKLQVEAKAKELDFISKKSDISRQQMQIEAEQMKLEDLKLKRQVAVQFGKEMAPVAAEVLQKAQNMYPDKVDGIKKMFLAAQAKLAEGDIDGANARYDLAMLELPDEWAKDAHERSMKAILEASNRFGIGLKMAKDPALVAAVKAAGGRIDIGDNGEPKVVTKQEIEIENLRRQQLEASIASERAQAAMYGNKQPAGGITQGQLINEVAQIDEAVKQLLVVPPQVDDPAKQYEINLGRAKLGGALAPIGVTPEQWSTMNSDQKLQAVFKSMSIAGGGQGGGIAAPTNIIQGGMPGTGQMLSPQNIQVARAGMVSVANKGPKEKADAIRGLLKAGDKEAKKFIDDAKNDPRFKKDPNSLNDPVKMFEYLAGKIAL